MASLRTFLVGGSGIGDDNGSSCSLATRFAETKWVTGRFCGGLKISTSDGLSSELSKESSSMDVLSTVRGGQKRANQIVNIPLFGDPTVVHFPTVLEVIC